MDESLSALGWRIAAKLDWIMGNEEAAAALIGALVTVAGLFVALVPVYVALRQNRAEREWRRSEVVRSLLSQMTDNPNIALIARVLDWREGPAPIPELFRPLFDSADAPRDGPRMFFEIEWPRFVASLPIVRVGDEWREPDLFMYRTCFDSFCSFIQGVADDIRTIGAREAEYADLSFYCYRVVFPKNGNRDDDPEAGIVMRQFIEGYYNKKTYDVILRHAELYAVTHPEDELPRASTLYPALFHHRSAIRRARQRREHKAAISPRDEPRARRHPGFSSYRRAKADRARERIDRSREVWHRRIGWLRDSWQWLRS